MGQWLSLTLTQLSLLSLAKFLNNPCEAMVAFQIQRYFVATKQMIIDFLANEFPQSKCVLEAIGERTSIVSHTVGFNELRPGGTVSGPLLMTVADVALYAAV